MARKQNYGMETQLQLLNIVGEREKPITPAEIAYRLDMPIEEVEENLNTLKKEGLVVETRIENLIEEGK